MKIFHYFFISFIYASTLVGFQHQSGPTSYVFLSQTDLEDLLYARALERFNLEKGEEFIDNRIIKQTQHVIKRAIQSLINKMPVQKKQYWIVLASKVYKKCIIDAIQVGFESYTFAKLLKDQEEDRKIIEELPDEYQALSDSKDNDEEVEQGVSQSLSDIIQNRIENVQKDRVIFDETKQKLVINN